MGEKVQFPSNGHSCTGYLALPSSPGPGVVVIQEWWGLVPHIKDVCDRFAAEGFVALAPDLYHGATTKEPDEAGKFLMAMKMEETARDMSGAVDFLRAQTSVEPKKIGVVGFCAGGGLALMLGAVEPLDAVVPFYPAFAHGEPDYARIRGAVLGHIAEHDSWTTPETAEKIFSGMRDAGVSAEMHMYPGTEHAFFNDSRPDVYAEEAARLAWDRTIAFFRKHLA